MPAIDFIAALGRLLRDGALRDALAADPRALAAQLGVRESDQAALLQLPPDDLEFQARVLLRKRFDGLRPVLPETCSRLGEEAWPVFHGYARAYWPSGDDPVILDACEFCRHLDRRHPGCLCDAEWNRVRFARSKKKRDWPRIGSTAPPFRETRAEPCSCCCADAQANGGRC